MERYDTGLEILRRKMAMYNDHNGNLFKLFDFKKLVNRIVMDLNRLLSGGLGLSRQQREKRKPILSGIVFNT